MLATKKGIEINREELAQRFDAKVDRDGPVLRSELGACHVWTGSRQSDGRGKIKLAGKDQLAHRVAFFLAHGRWPNPCALHKCDGGEIGCVRLDHLFEGTYADNTRDMVTKGRCKRAAARGEASGRAKLTQNQVLEIRSALAMGESQRAVARRFRVGKSTIGVIATGKGWAHLAA